MTNDQWKLERKTGIGGSDVSAICGCNPWRTALDTYLDKTGHPAGDVAETEQMRLGHDIEPVIANVFQRKTDLNVLPVPWILAHPKYDWCKANIDRLIVDEKTGNGILEIKNTTMGDAWMDGNIPDYYYLQLQWYLFITGLKYGYFAVLINGKQFIHTHVDRDDEIIESVFKICKTFWESHVIPQIPPEPDGSKAGVELIKLLYPKANPTTTIDLPDSARELLHGYQESDEKLKEYETLKNMYGNKLKLLMGDNERGIIDDYIIKWSNVSTERMDTKRFKSEQPELFGQYCRVTESRRFIISNKTKGE